MPGSARPSTITALGLTVDDGGQLSDVIVELPPGASVGALARALSTLLPNLPARTELQVARTRETLPHDAVAMDRDLRAGDTLIASPGLRRATRVLPDPEPMVGLRRRAPVSREDEVVIGGAVRLKSAQLRRAEPRLAAGPRVASIAFGGARVDVHPGEHAIALDADGVPYLSAPSAGAICLLRSDGATLDLLPAPDGPDVSLDGTVCGLEWAPVGASSRIRVGGLLGAVSFHGPSAPTTPRAERVVIGDAADTRTRVDLNVGGEIAVHRPPRRVTSWRPATIKLPETPRPQNRVRLPLAAALVPLVAGLLMFVLFKSATMLAFMALSPMMAGATYFTDRRARKQDGEGTAARFESRLDQSYRDLVQALTVEASERRAAAPPVTTLLVWIDQLGPRLWERRPWDADFLTLRVGPGDLPAAGKATTTTSADVEPDPRLQTLADAAQLLTDVPATVALGERPVLGLAGSRVATTALARSLVVQAAALHSPLELGLIAALPPGAEDGWEWLKWLPHAQTGAALLQRPSLGTGRQAVDVLRALRDAGARRRETQRTARPSDDAAQAPAMLVLIDEQLQLDRALVSEILADAERLKYGVIWVGHDPRSLPGECGTTIDCRADGLATVTDVATAVDLPGITVETLPAADASRAARALAPARDVTLADAGGTVPDRVKLLDQLALASPTPAAVAERWQRRKRGLGAEIGVAAGQSLAIDLRHDGPHALIAGTTGAGKSELLRTIVASLAAAHPPTRLTFLLIDYKGGAAFAPCADLPHVLDVVSDLDAELGERALVSLGAEMKYREQLLADTRADNLLDLERRAPHLAPPNLIIMVDEFAKLREEIPDFVDGVVDVAQRGRTLGIHMVLAAQSLRNSFTPAVRANTNLRIALRVTSDTESQDVIDANEAARIPSGERRRGRAFARIGHERLVEFQSSHVSGRFTPPGEQEVVARLFPFDAIPTASNRKTQTDDAPPGSDETDLAALRRAVVGASSLLGLPAPRPAWTAPLPEALSRAQVQPHTVGTEGRVAIGLIDQPHQQRQSPLVLELDRGHVAIYGGGGAGKTVALQTIAATLAWDMSPSDLQIHAIDAESGGLSLIAALPHVSAVVSGGDAERIERLLERIEGEVARRATRLSTLGASTLTEYNSRPDTEILPRIVVLLDGMGEFGSLYDTARPDSLFDRLTGLLGGARSVGVHVVVTADRRAAIRSAVAASFPTRILLRQTSSDDLVAFGIPAKTADRVVLRDGRAFIEGAAIAQLALPDPAAGATDLADGFRRLGAHLEGAWPGERARAIGAMPDAVGRDTLKSAANAVSAIALGVGGAELNAETVDLSERHFLIAGGYRSGRTTALTTLALGALELLRADELSFVHVLAPRRSALTALKGWTSVASGLDPCADLVKTLASEILDFPDQQETRGVVMIDDAGELQDPQVVVALERLVRLGRDRGIRIVAAAEISAARMLGNLWLRELRRDAHGLLLSPDLIADGDVLSIALPRRSNVAMGPGRGFLVARNAARLVQVAA